MKAVAPIIPDALIYEMVNGKPIYYKGYKDYLNREKDISELLGSSKIQSILAGEIYFLLRSLLGEEYLIFINELGVKFAHKSWRAADIALIKPELVNEIDNKYLEVPPEVVIEIDTKADLWSLKNPLSYSQEKTKELLAFGVEKVIWVFTDTEKVLVAENGKKWEISDFEEDITVVRDMTINIEEILKGKGIRL